MRCKPPHLNESVVCGGVNKTRKIAFFHELKTPQICTVCSFPQEGQRLGMYINSELCYSVGHIAIMIQYLRGCESKKSRAYFLICTFKDSFKYKPCHTLKHAILHNIFLQTFWVLKIIWLKTIFISRKFQANHCISNI